MPSYLYLLWMLFYSSKTPVNTIAPLLESNQPPYSLVNFTLESDPHVDHSSEAKKHELETKRCSLDTQFVRQKSKNLHFLETEREMAQCTINSFDGEAETKSFRFPTNMKTTCRLLLSTIKASSLCIRSKSHRFFDEARMVDKSLISIENQLGIRKKGGRVPVVDFVDRSLNIDDRTDSSIQNLKNSLHRKIWLSLKKRDKSQFRDVCMKLRSSNVKLDGVSYTLLIHGNLFFGLDINHCLEILEEMKKNGVHPCLVRFNARIVASCEEMSLLNASPTLIDINQLTRASWLIAVLATKRLERKYGAVIEEDALSSSSSSLILTDAKSKRT